MHQTHFQRFLICVSALALVMAVSVGNAAVIWNEASNGDLSNNQAAPNAFTLTSGTNSIIGSVGTGDTQDWVALTIPTGLQLSSDVLAAYSSTDVQGFTGVQAGSAFVGNPETTPSAYLGYAHYGTGAVNGPLPSTNLIGANLLPIMGNTTDAPGSQGFTGPLPAGTYTFLIQQLGATTTYQFDFGVTPTPEPAGPCVLLGLVGLGLLRRRQSAFPFR